jgi:hypothetical protein
MVIQRGSIDRSAQRESARSAARRNKGRGARELSANGKAKSSAEPELAACANSGERCARSRRQGAIASRDEDGNKHVCFRRSLNLHVPTRFCERAVVRAGARLRAAAADGNFGAAWGRKAACGLSARAKRSWRRRDVAAAATGAADLNDVKRRKIVGDGKSRRPDQRAADSKNTSLYMREPPVARVVGSSRSDLGRDSEAAVSTA